MDPSRHQDERGSAADIDLTSQKDVLSSTVVTDSSTHRNEPSSSDSNPKPQTVPFEILEMIFTHCIEDDEVQEPSMVWYIYWMPEVEGESTILVPYVLMNQYEPTIPGMKRKSPNSMLGVCRQSRSAALDPAKGRYASLAMMYPKEQDEVDAPFDSRDRSRRVIVHPYHDVFVFTSPDEDLRFTIPILFFIPGFGDSLGFGGSVACEIGDGMHLYDEDTDLLYAAVQRTGFRFRNVLLPNTFCVEKDFEQVCSLWVLLHLCEGTCLCAHQFHVFINPNSIPGKGDDGLFPGAAPFIRVSRKLGFSALKTYPYTTQVKDEKQDCQCCRWPDRHRIFEVRECHEESWDDKIDNWVRFAELGIKLVPRGRVPIRD